MATTLTQDEMVELVREHDAQEAAGDVDAVMATVAADPFYEFLPLGYRIHGREGVSELYRRVLPMLKQVVAGASQHNIWFSDDGYATEYEFNIQSEDGRPHTSSVIAAFTFDGRLMKSERAFLDPEFAALFKKALGEDFLSVPGVSRRQDKA